MKSILTTSGVLLLGALTTGTLQTRAATPVSTDPAATTTPNQATVMTSPYTLEEQALMVQAAIEGASSVHFDVLAGNSRNSKNALLRGLREHAYTITTGAVSNIDAVNTAEDYTALRERTVRYARAVRTGMIHAAESSLVGHQGITRADIINAIDNSVALGVQRGASEIDLPIGEVVVASNT